MLNNIVLQSINKRWESSSLSYFIEESVLNYCADSIKDQFTWLEKHTSLDFIKAATKETADIVVTTLKLSSSQLYKVDLESFSIKDNDNDNENDNEKEDEKDNKVEYLSKAIIVFNKEVEEERYEELQNWQLFGRSVLLSLGLNSFNSISSKEETVIEEVAALTLLFDTTQSPLAKVRTGFLPWDLETLRSLYGSRKVDTANNIYKLSSYENRMIVSDEGENVLDLSELSFTEAALIKEQFILETPPNYVKWDESQFFTSFSHHTTFSKFVLPPEDAICCYDGAHTGHVHNPQASIKYSTPLKVLSTFRGKAMTFGFAKDFPESLRKKVRLDLKWVAQHVDIMFREEPFEKSHMKFQWGYRKQNHAGWAYYPMSSSVASVSSDVFLNSKYKKQFLSGSFDSTITHEIGHALGLAHTHNSGVSKNLDRGYNSIMSYKRDRNVETFQRFDLDTLRASYGAKLVNTGNNTYKLQDFLYSMIVDDDGVDTLDLSDFSIEEANSIKQQVLSGENKIIWQNKYSTLSNQTRIEKFIMPGNSNSNSGSPSSNTKSNNKNSQSKPQSKPQSNPTAQIPSSSTKEPTNTLVVSSSPTENNTSEVPSTTVKVSRNMMVKGNNIIIDLPEHFIVRPNFKVNGSFVAFTILQGKLKFFELQDPNATITALKVDGVLHPLSSSSPSNTGDDTYTLDSINDRVEIFDDGGFDTIDLSNLSMPDAKRIVSILKRKKPNKSLLIRLGSRKLRRSKPHADTDFFWLFLSPNSSIEIALLPNKKKIKL